MFSITLLSDPHHASQSIHPVSQAIPKNWEIELLHTDNVNQLNGETIRNTDLLILPYCYAEQETYSLWMECRQLNPQLLLIVMVDENAASHAIHAFKSGAFDVLTEPLQPQQIALALERTHQFIAHRNRLLSQHTQPDLESSGPVAVSNAMQRTLGLLHQIRHTDLPVLLVGETGTGKNVLAAHLHQIGPRQKGPFLTVNCGAISPNLLESELFGHEKGAFTGASSRRVGLLEAADGGTLFLDEINSASPELQVRLLQFIQDKTLLRVGARTAVSVDVHLVFATNQPLKPLVDAGDFREDLFFRLNVFPIDIPPLRERIEDISYLAARFLFKHAPRMGKTVNSCGPGVLSSLQNYPWPGNVRELENVMQRALILCENSRIEMKDLPSEIVSSTYQPEVAFKRPACLLPENATLEEVERYWIEQTLKKYQGNKLRASEALGINPTTLWRKLKQPETHPDDSMIFDD